ncbi:MAG: type II toxin-antitoxin system RelE/ParE family toxin [Terriglobales bacterium]
MKVRYRQSASDDVVRQFRYYLIDQNLPEVADRFLDAIRHTIESLREHPLVGPLYQSTTLAVQNLRSWPVAGFEVIRIYYLLDSNTIHVIRILHGKRDLKSILERERPD